MLHVEKGELYHRAISFFSTTSRTIIALDSPRLGDLGSRRFATGHAAGSRTHIHHHLDEFYQATWEQVASRSNAALTRAMTEL